MKNVFFLLLGVAMCVMTASAQKTGSFDETITFNSQPRTLSNYVPTTYDANKSYRLIVGLHGLGDNSANYRAALVNSLSFETAFPNTILVCPDGGSDQGKDFYTPVGDEAIIQEAINYAKANYNINSSEVILQGFSLGGRSALKYGLDNPAMFKALLLNTPAIQGVKEADNGSGAFTFNYSNAAQLPIFITLGSDDVNYEGPIEFMVFNLVENNAGVSYRQFNGGHVIPDFKNYPYLNFFNQPYNNNEDASVYRVTLPARTCDGNIVSSVLLQNTGTNVLDSVAFAYGVGSQKDTFTWQGNLTTNNHKEVVLPSYKAAALNVNTYDFEVDVLTINKAIADTFIDDNGAVGKTHIMTTALTLPFIERFNTTADIDKWASINSGDYILPFDYTQSDGAPFTFNSIFIFENGGTKEEILSPNLNFTGQSKAYLHFKVDYNYTKYTAAILGIDTALADTLEVFISTDCGGNYTSLFKKAGADLSGHSTPIIDPLNLSQVALDVDMGSYRAFNIDVSQYAGQANVHFKFSYISGLGGYIYLDDVIVNNDPASTEDIKLTQNKIMVYPNPASTQLNVSAGNEVIKNIQILNILGQVAYQVEGNGRNTQALSVSDLPKGAYWIKVLTNEQELTDKVIIQ